MNRVVVVDLDECLCSINSFRFWLLFSYFFLFLSGHWKSFFKFNQFIIWRILSKSDRIQMKRDILSITEEIPEKFIAYFCHFLFLLRNRQVLDEIANYQNQQISIVLSTAAPACYVVPFAAKFGFSKIFSTPSVNQLSWQENSQHRKLELLSLFYGDELKIECVITDHHDDLPLLLKAEKRILVNPTEKTLDEIGHLFEMTII